MKTSRVMEGWVRWKATCWWCRSRSCWQNPVKCLPLLWDSLGYLFDPLSSLVTGLPLWLKFGSLQTQFPLSQPLDFLLVLLLSPFVDSFVLTFGLPPHGPVTLPSLHFSFLIPSLTHFISHAHSVVLAHKSQLSRFIFTLSHPYLPYWICFDTRHTAPFCIIGHL